MSRKKIKDTRSAFAAIICLNFTTAFLGCSGINLVGSDEQGNTVAVDVKPPSAQTPSSSSATGNIDDDPDINLSPSSSSATGSTIDVPESNANGEALKALLDASQTAQVFNDAADAPVPEGTALIAITESGELIYSISNIRQSISCNENGVGKHSYTVSASNEDIVKEFESSSTPDHAIFMNSCQSENGVYELDETTSRCTIKTQGPYSDKNWRTMSDKVISHCN